MKKTLSLNDYLDSSRLADNKYKLLIEKIQSESSLDNKVDGLATLVFMLINNDISCLEAEVKSVKSLLKKLYKRILIFGIAIVILFLFFNPESLNLILQIIKFCF